VAGTPRVGFPFHQLNGDGRVGGVIGFTHGSRGWWFKCEWFQYQVEVWKQPICGFDQGREVSPRPPRGVCVRPQVDRGGLGEASLPRGIVRRMWEPNSSVVRHSQRSNSLGT
jgi:hypothetical protein